MTIAEACRFLRSAVASVLVWSMLAGAGAAAAAAALSGAAFEQRLRALETELRCLVCQNQTIADSNAGLAEDLRREVREQALAGRTDDQIKQYLRDRYGDFVLYDPPMEPATWVLWFGPFLLLLITFVIAGWLILRRSRPTVPTPLEVVEVERIERILKPADSSAQNVLERSA